MVQNQLTASAVDMPQTGGSKHLDDDEKIKRTGSVWTTSAHIITAVIGSGVLSLAWATAQLGWLAGPVVMLLFSMVAYFTFTLLAACYRSGDLISGKRNYTFMDAVRSNLGGVKVKLCGIVQYLNLLGVAIGYTIISTISMMAIERSNCFHETGGKDTCPMNSNPYMIAFGLLQIIFSQIPDFDQLWWLSILAAVLSFTYSSAGLALGIAQVVANGKVKGSLTGIRKKIWRSFQALGDIAFAYSYSIILIEIQDTVKSRPSEEKTMKKAALVSVGVITLFDFIEKLASIQFPDRLGFKPFRLNFFRLIWRTVFVIITTVISMLLPFFNDVVGLLGALGFWPLMVYFPVEMYIEKKKIPRWSTRWVCLQVFSSTCLVVSIAAAAGSIAGVVLDLKSYKPFRSDY